MGVGLLAFALLLRMGLRLMDIVAGLVRTIANF